MGFKEISGIEFTCDNCTTTVMMAGDADVDGKMLLPKGWFSGLSFESSGERGVEHVAANWMACKASCIGNAVRKMIDAARPTEKGDA